MFDGVGNLILRFRDLADRKQRGDFTAKEEAEWADVRRQLAKALRDSAAPGGRRSPRIASTIGVTVLVGEEPRQGEATSLNAHGVGVNLAHAPDIGTRVRVRLERSALAGATLEFQGKVVSVRDRVTGIEFQDLSDTDRELLTVVMLEEYLG